MCKFYGFLTAIALALFASSAQAAIVFDDFNTNAGHFSSPANSSGTTNILHTATGTANQNVTARTTVDPFEGLGALDIGIVGGGQSNASPSFPRIRFLSGSGTIANNTTFTTSAGTDGWIGFYYKVPAPGTLPTGLPSGLQLQINLDGNTGAAADSDSGIAINAIMDGQWHLAEWDLDNPAHWVATAGIGGNGVLENGITRAIDSIYFRYPVGTTWGGYTGSQTLNIDFVGKTDSGTVANHPALIPEPASLGLLAVAGLGLFRRRK